MSLSYSKERTPWLYRWGVLFVAVVVLACTDHSPQQAEDARARQKLAELVGESEKLEGKIKDASNDPGLRYHLVTDHELLKSRIERMKENLHIKGDISSAGAGGGEGGSGGAHAEKAASH